MAAARAVLGRFSGSLLAGLTGLSLALAPNFAVPHFAAVNAVERDDASDTGANTEPVVSPDMAEATGQVTAFVRFRGSGAFEATQPEAVRSGRVAPVDARAQVQQITATVARQAEQVADLAGADVLYTVQNSMRGVALTGDAEAIRALAGRSDVQKISRIVAKSPQNSLSDVSTGALGSWVQTGKTGQGVRIAVIDTGIDYTHAAFGGPGTATAYEKAAKLTDFPAQNSGLYDSAKVVGGYDFAGDNYDAFDPLKQFPQPDGNPLDCAANGHGTHVAATAAGYGVDSDGKPVRAGHTQLSADDVYGMKIGPGSAPAAELIAFRVFGCSGQTTLTGLALDRVLDPNGDGDFSDRAHIVNLSVSTDFGAVDDPENVLIDALTRQGVLTVSAAGNATSNAHVGDAYSMMGDPGSALSGISVANSSTPREYGNGTVTVSGSRSDTLRNSSARGMHGSQGFTKPDVAAPGTSIVSASAGSGDQAKTMTGTSMAAPHVAGIAALVWEARPGFSPLQVKTAVINSARHDVLSSAGAVMPVDRVGAGRVDALAAVQQGTLLYNAQNLQAVSLSFGVQEVAAQGRATVLTRQVTIHNTEQRARTYRLAFEQSASMPGVTFSYPQTVTVAPGAKRNITVSVTIDPAKMEKANEPGTPLQQQSQARQFIASASGRLSLYEGDRFVARMPLHIAPKPVADMVATGDFSVLKNLDSQMSSRLSGASLSRPGYRSLLGVFELGERSGRLPADSFDQGSLWSGDLQYVGAYSNASELAYPADGTLAFGVSMWQNWSVLSPALSTRVLLDTNGDRRADFWLKVERKPGLDYPLARLYTAEQGTTRLVAEYPVNGSYGDLDTNTMDSNTMALPVKLADLGISSGAINYRVETHSWYLAGGLVDSTNWISYQPFAPNVKVSGGTKVNDVLFADSAGQNLKLMSSGRAYGLLFLHLHNGTGDLSGVKAGEDGGRAQAVILNDNLSFSNAVVNPRFRDIGAGDAFYHEVAWLATNGISTGWPDRTFRPLNNVERGAMAAFFYRMAGSPAYTPPATSPFTDVPTDHQFYEEISWMAERGVTTGWPDGTFRPDAPVNRDAMAAFFYRLAGSPGFTAPAASPFTDISAGDQFYREVSWLAHNKISTGWADGTFRPVQPVNRDAMAAFIYRFEERGLYQH